MSRYRKMGMSAKAWFGKVEVPYTSDPEPNDPYWQEKLTYVMVTVCGDPALLAVWESDLVPDYATYREHYELAAKIVRGELKINQSVDSGGSTKKRRSIK